jgi:hypothetical protein
MKKLELIPRSNYNTYFVTPDESLCFPLNLDEINYLSHIDLENKTYVEGKGGADSQLPTINRLIAEGKLIERLYQEEVALYTRSFPSRASYKKWMDYFKARGFNVTREALEHNYKAWCMDVKSGYRDEENNYHLFSPCGCNELSFSASRLDEYFDWQETYGLPVFD